MITFLNTVHEETYSDGDRTLGVLMNYNEEENFKDCYIYVYRSGMYIFFNTMVELYDYLLNGESGMLRAYMEEQEFDEYYDAECLDGKFGDALKWIKTIKN
jgi:hypothetical protein